MGMGTGMAGGCRVLERTPFTPLPQAPPVGQKYSSLLPCFLKSEAFFKAPHLGEKKSLKYSR